MPSTQPRKKRRSGRRKFPAHPPRETKEYGVDPVRDLPDFDPSKGYQIIDYDTCEELCLPPQVIVHKRPVVLYSTREGETRLATVGGMALVFPKCAASPEVLAKIAVDWLSAGAFDAVPVDDLAGKTARAGRAGAGERDSGWIQSARR